jgi:hypothetical protein
MGCHPLIFEVGGGKEYALHRDKNKNPIYMLYFLEYLYMVIHEIQCS